MAIAIHLHQLDSSILALFQAGNSMGEGGMIAMMTACIVFGLVLFIALVELVILEFIWVKIGLRGCGMKTDPCPRSVAGLHRRDIVLQVLSA
jgi:hypothetical protein